MSDDVTFPLTLDRALWRRIQVRAAQLGLTRRAFVLAALDAALADPRYLNDPSPTRPKPAKRKELVS